MKVLFLDTNMFLQCRDLLDLPWDKISESENLLLLISRPVQEEIDRLKNDRSSRRAKRARKTNSFIKKIILAEDSKLVIRESRPRVEVTLPPPLPPQSNLDPILDPSRADDQIIAQAIACKAAFSDADVAILTHDTNPILTAKRCGLSYIIVPDDWLLEPEPDDRDKKIQELEKRLKELERSRPQIEIVGQDRAGNCIDSLLVSVKVYRPLTESELKGLLAEVQTTHPMVTKFDEPKGTPPSSEAGLGAIYQKFYGLTHRYQPPREEEIREYKEVKYPQWLEEVEKLFKSLPSRIEFLDRQIELSISISNKGNAPAENVVMELTALGGFVLDAFFHRSNKDDRQSSSEFPVPPLPPKGKWIRNHDPYASLIGSFQRIDQFIKPLHDLPGPFFLPEKTKSRDKNAFYWKHGKPSKYEESWTLECEEFRHLMGPEIFKIIIFVPPKEKIESGALKCRVTAKNLPTPVEYTLPIKITYVQKDVINEAQSILQKSKS
jgi:hypothetical protein